MARYAVPTTVDELTRLLEARGIVEGGRLGYIYPDGPGNGLPEKAWKDLEKVQFDQENCDLGWRDQVPGQYIETLPNGVTVAYITAGGDWEWPVHYVIYNTDKGLRCYVPKNGNTWNQATNSAFGSEEEGRKGSLGLMNFASEQEARDHLRRWAARCVDPRTTLDVDDFVANAHVYAGRDNTYHVGMDSLYETEDWPVRPDFEAMKQDIMNRIEVR